MITSKIETITPKLAGEYLDEHYARIDKGKYRQRQVYRVTLNKYVGDMKAGHWRETPVPIIFDENGNLSDGQHRLEAVRQSGMTHKFRVERGWPPDVIDSIDRGKTRTVADQLRLHGFHNTTTLSASVAAVVRVAYKGKAPAISYASCMHVLDKLGMRDHIERCISIMCKHKMVGGRCIGPIAWYRTVNRKKADEFMRQVSDLDMEKGSGSWLYAKYMRDRNPSNQESAIVALCACLRLFDSGGKQDYVKFTTEAVDWLSSLNPKLKENITNLFGLISVGRGSIKLEKKILPPEKKQ